MNSLLVVKSFWFALVAAIIAVLLMMASFFLLEPTVGQAVNSQNFTIRQQITDQISFTVEPSNVTMDGNIQGLTGGNATGTTYAVVRTNSAGGYIMSIAFTNNGTPNAMLGETTASESIRDYASTTAPASTEPDLLFWASTSAMFAYTVGSTTDGSSPSDLDDSFKDNGSTCNQGAGSFTFNRCWKTPTVAGYQIVNRGSSAPDGATTTIQFKVHVPNTPNPSLDSDWYTATATLTATNQ